MHLTFYCFLLQDRVGQASNELSGDLDTPEGGFDGLMQATMCEQVILTFFERWLSRVYIEHIRNVLQKCLCYSSQQQGSPSTGLKH